jgi:hypothetical protein
VNLLLKYFTGCQIYLVNSQPSRMEVFKFFFCGSFMHGK